MSGSIAIPPDTIIGQKYRINRKIGSGSFGEIYSGTMVYQDSNQQARTAASARGGGAGGAAAAGRTPAGAAGRGGGGAGALRCAAGPATRADARSRSSPSLEDLFNQCGRKFSLKTTLQLADQLLERAETLHENHLIHRDIKPANFVTSVGEQASVFCIDFGLSKRYRHPHTMQHIPYREGRSLTGTPRYASVANHQGVETSRRDDLESIGYILVYFLLGKLPWQGLKVPPNVSGTASQKHRLILDKKQLTPLPELCRGCPVEFQEFIQYCRELQFDAKPNMTYVRNLFRDLYRRHGFENPKQWDWDAPRPGRDVKPAIGAGAGNAAPLKLGDNTKSRDDAKRPGTAEATRLRRRDKPVDKVTVTIPRPATSDTANATGRPGTADAYGGAPTPKSAAAAYQPLARSDRWGGAGDRAPPSSSGAPATAGGSNGGDGANSRNGGATGQSPEPGDGAHPDRELRAGSQGTNTLKANTRSSDGGSGHQERQIYQAPSNVLPSDVAGASSRSASGGGNRGLFQPQAQQSAAPRPTTSGGTRARPSTAPSGGSSQANNKASSFWKRAAEDDKPPGSSSRAVAGGAQSAWGEGPRRPRGGGSEKHGGGYVLDEGYGNGGARTAAAAISQASQLHYRHHEQAQSHLVGGSLSLMRHRRASARDRAAQSQATKYHVGGSANYGYSNYGFAAQANAPSLWGHQQQSRHTAWNTAGGAPRSKTPMRPASAVRAERHAVRHPPRPANPEPR
ncbi:protein kinase [Aureococcus anophagefferens]|nr:protein kinase [Aureococcus anophagefferens]